MCFTHIRRLSAPRFGLHKSRPGFTGRCTFEGTNTQKQMPIVSAATRENFQIAFGAIRSQKLRATLTILIIAFGIMCLVGIITVAQAMENKINNEFSRLGSNTFTVYSANSRSEGGHGGRSEKNFEPFSYDEALAFTSSYKVDAYISMSAFGGLVVVEHGSEKTNPNITLLGCDAKYFELSSYSIASGRNFSANDITSGNNVIILGKDIVDKLFPPSVEPVGKEVSVADKKYVVIGTLEPKGNTFGFAGDNQCMIPVSNLRRNFGSAITEYSINVRVKSGSDMDKAVSEAKGLLRIVRGDRPGQEDSFEIEKSDSLAAEVIGLTDNLKFGAIFIGLITLASAGIGLMNIMLVSVSERTREIGVRKSIGASSTVIKRQFLIESVVIGQIGGITGIMMGIALANIISTYVGFGIAMPWFWMFFGALLCFLVSVVSGYYPASKAARLDPIEALRYE